MTMAEGSGFILALFFCQNTPGSGLKERQDLEEAYGGAVRLFSVPCGGRIETLHLLKALEEFADATYLVTCPEGACRYFEGNRRAEKRVERARSIINGIGLEAERIGVLVRPRGDQSPLTALVERIWARISTLGPSPVHRKAA